MNFLSTGGDGERTWLVRSRGCRVEKGRKVARTEDTGRRVGGSGGGAQDGLVVVKTELGQVSFKLPVTVYTQ